MTVAREEKAAQVELLISWLLRLGVLVSLALVVAGTGVTLVHHPEYFTDPHALETLIGPAAVFPRRPGQVLHGLAAGRGQAVVVLGLLVLIATPVLRVAVSIAAFAYQRDRTFVVITSFVLGLLAVSFFIGGHSS